MSVTPILHSSKVRFDPLRTLCAPGATRLCRIECSQPNYVIEKKFPAWATSPVSEVTNVSRLLRTAWCKSLRRLGASYLRTIIAIVFFEHHRATLWYLMTNGAKRPSRSEVKQIAAQATNSSPQRAIG